MGLESALGAAKAGFSLGGKYADIENAKDEHQQIREAQKLTRESMKKQQKRIIGARIAEVGSSGLELTGSPLTAINQATYELELDRAIVMENFERAKEDSRARIKKMKVSAITSTVSSLASVVGKKGPSMAQPGKAGYGKNVPKGTVDTGSYSQLPQK